MTFPSAANATQILCRSRDLAVSALCSLCNDQHSVFFSAHVWLYECKEDVYRTTVTVNDKALHTALKLLSLCPILVPLT